MDILLFLSRIANHDKTPQSRSKPDRQNFDYEVEYEELEYEIEAQEEDEEDWETDVVAKDPLTDTRKSKIRQKERYSCANKNPESVEFVFSDALNVR